MEKGIVNISNHYAFRDLSFVYLVWNIYNEGKLIQTGKIEDLNNLPGEDIQLQIPVSSPKNRAGENILLISIQLKDSASWAPAGHEIAFEEFILSGNPIRNKNNSVSVLPKLTDHKDVYSIEGNDFHIEFSKKEGAINSWNYKGKSIIEKSGKLNIWRAPTDNDEGGGEKSFAKRWINAGYNNYKHEINSTESLTEKMR
ncbi:MAG: DUF4981 domain-containing protein [Bacteroidales bacterium]|nr:DUF4981 domain-containing protein [Bacteroidales bacterium]